MTDMLYMIASISIPTLLLTLAIVSENLQFVIATEITHKQWYLMLKLALKWYD